MLKAGAPQRLSIDPASASLYRRLLMLATRLGFILESEQEIEALSDWEVVQLVEPMIRREPRTRSREFASRRSAREYRCPPR